MILSDLSIRRPVLATVMNLLLVVLGLGAVMKLPVREYPAIDPPIVSITTVYKGAANTVIEAQITQIVENAVAGLEGIKEITSSSQDERSNVTVEFNAGRNIDSAAADVRDRVSRVIGRLPDGVETPIVAKADANSSAMLWVGISSTAMDPLELTDYLRRNVVDRLSTVDGVASITVGGERRYALRITLDPAALQARNLTPLDIERVIKANTTDRPSGRLTLSQRELTIKTDVRLAKPEDYTKLVVAKQGGQLVTLGEVAKVVVGAEDERYALYSSGTPAIALGVVRQSTANTLSVAEGVRKILAEVEPTLPAGTDMKILYDESRFVDASIKGVTAALFEGIILVVIVMWLFLRSIRATLIAAIAIPVSLIASFMAFSTFNFSINVLTLLAIVLAVGIVVDDAIVVIENVFRKLEAGLAPKLAAIEGSREIGFAVIATTLSLVAVFLPLSMMPGRTGQLFREFGVVLAVAIAFSGFLALTLTPMLCSKLLRASDAKAVHHEAGKPQPKWIAWYEAALKTILSTPRIAIIVGLGIAIAAGALFALLKKEFAPIEDRATIITRVNAPEGASAAYTRRQMEQVEAIVQPYIKSGVVDNMLSILAPGLQRPAPVNSGLVLVRLKPWGERTMKQQELHAKIAPAISAIPGARAFPVNPPSLGQSFTAQPVQFVLLGPEYETLKQWRDVMLEKALASGKFANIESDFRESQPDLKVQINRALVADLNLTPLDITNTLELLYGERQVGTFLFNGQEYVVLTQANDKDNALPSRLNSLMIRNTTGTLIPMGTFMNLQESAGPQTLNRVTRLRAITLQGTPAVGVSLGEAITTLEALHKQNLPTTAQSTLQGQSREFRESSNAVWLTFAFALLIVYLVLAAQFESWLDPFIILTSVPLALAGGFLALWLTGNTLNIYSQIGLVLLIGLLAKNGILIVEFANQRMEQGARVADAAFEAACTRLRPIVMTSIATILGAVPLILSSGAGAESRASIGVVVVGGMLLSTALSLFLVPALLVSWKRD